jgi:hypothetical protein
MYTMSITQLADAKEDFDHWKEIRKGYLSSSEVFTWIGNTPDWWKDDRRDVLDGKRGVEKTFDRETETSIAHGSFDEENIQAKFGHAVGCEVQPHNGFFVNDRWPLIGASIDGFGVPASTASAAPGTTTYPTARCPRPPRSTPSSRKTAPSSRTSGTTSTPPARSSSLR